MKTSRKLLSLILVLLLVVSISVPAFAAGSGKTDKDTKQYTTVFIHGLMGWGYNDAISELACYWGMVNGNMIDYLNGLGYDTVNASVGPLSSCWDRCCELFAQLTGTKTDYGAAHSMRCEADFANDGSDLKHDRYGRDYTGAAIVKNWGPIYKNGKVTGWYDNKLNLVGHSFGGPTSAMFLYLLEEGDADEIAWGKQQAAKNGGDWHDYVSPLFWGDYNGRYLINSITSLAGVLNGTTFLSTCKNSAEVIMTIVTAVANTLGLTDIAYLYDFQLEHFGITKTPGAKLTDEQYCSLLKQSGFLDGYDNALYDLSVQGCNELKQGWVTYDNVYYFGFAGNKTWEEPVTGYHVPDPDITILFAAWSYDMGHDDYSFEQVKDIYGNNVMNTNKEWMANDGMVNTISARYPIGAKNKPYDENNIVPGVWQWQDQDYDHGQFICRMLPFDTAACRSYFRWIMKNIDASYAVSDLPFKDVPANFWAYNYIKTLYNKGVINGTSATTFDPNSPVTRGQFAKMLGLLYGVDAKDYSTCKFPDVSKSSVFAPYIQWASENGIVLGYEDGTFRPNENISRQQMAAMICRYADFANIKLSAVNKEMHFSDESNIADYALSSVKTLQKAGILQGYDNGDGTFSFNPGGSTTRAATCAVLCRIP